MKKFLTPKWIITAYFIILGILLTVNVLPPNVAMPLLTIAGILMNAGIVLLVLLIVIAITVGCVRIIRGKPVLAALLVLSLLAGSCKKEQVNTPDAIEMGRLIGMDMNVWHSVTDRSTLPAGMVPIQFNSIEEARAYFTQNNFDKKGVKGVVVKTTLLKDPDQPSNTITLTTVILYTSYNVTFTWTRANVLGFGTGGGYYAVSGITSNMGGFGGTAWGWSQTGQSYYNYPNSSIIHIVVTARQSFNFKIKEWDGAYQQNMRIEIDYNVKDHTYHMYVWNNAVGH